MLEVIKRFEFEAAHYLKDYDGPCRYLHGHSYKLDIGVSPKVGEMLKDDMVIDFKQLKTIVHDALIQYWDHTCLNEHQSLEGNNPTAERMVQYIVKMLTPFIHEAGAKLTLVDLWETADSHCKWTI